MDTGGAVGEDLDEEPSEQRERHAEGRRPVQDVPPKGLVPDHNQKVADEVHRRQPAPRRCEQRERGGPQQDLHEVHDEEHAEAARLRRGRVAHVPAACECSFAAMHTEWAEVSVARTPGGGGRGESAHP
jgi:hypothetical protein